VAEETCSFGVCSGFQTFFHFFPKNFSKLFQTFWKKWLWKKVWEKNGSHPEISELFIAMCHAI
jgi:hypothetical protein